MSRGKFSGGKLTSFREGWALLFGCGSFAKPHYWRRRDLSDSYRALCGLECDQSEFKIGVRGAFGPGDFMVDRCKHCSRRHAKDVRP